MAHFSKERKAEIAPVIKAIAKKYGVIATLSIRNGDTIILNINSGKVDFFTRYNEVRKHNADLRGDDYYPVLDHITVNTHSLDKFYTGPALEFLKEAYAVINEGNHDNSDITRDHFDVGFYADINIGRWNKPYELKV